MSYKRFIFINKFHFINFFILEFKCSFDNLNSNWTENFIKWDVLKNRNNEFLANDKLKIFFEVVLFVNFV